MATPLPTWSHTGSRRSGQGYGTCIVVETNAYGVRLRYGVMLSYRGDKRLAWLPALVETGGSYGDAEDLADRFCHACCRWNDVQWLASNRPWTNWVMDAHVFDAR